MEKGRFSAFTPGTSDLDRVLRERGIDTLIITGTLTKLENVNPHSWWYVDVKGADGKVTSWKLESLSPAGLIRQGLKVKTELHIGDTYSYRISPAWKDPDSSSKLGFMRSITVNGKEYVVVEL